jgi:hypothetical protein
MSFHSWLQNLRPALALHGGQRQHGRRGLLRAATHRLSVEALEDRLTPSFSSAGLYNIDDFNAMAPNFTWSYPQGPGLTADFNGDGKLDLVSVAWPLGQADAIGSLFLARGDGTFDLEESWDLGDSVEMFGVGDFNGDGRPDLAIKLQDVSVAGDGLVGVSLNNGDFPGSPAVPASSFAVSGFPSPTSAGQAATFTVTALDSSGNVLTGCNGTVHFTSSDPNAGLPADYTFRGADYGVHTFIATLKTEGPQSITVTQGDATGTQADITVAAPTAGSLAVAGFPSPTIAGQAGSFTVTALDTLGNVATGYTGTVHFSSNDLPAVLPTDYTFTAADNGTHSFSATLYTANAGYRTIYVSDATTGIGGVDNPITVNAAAASTMSVAGFPSITTAGVAGRLTVTLKDPYGNIAGGYRGTVHFTSSDAKAVLPANYTFTAADAGVHTFSALLKTAGVQSVTARDTVTAGLTNTDGGITVNAARASQFFIAVPPSVTVGVAFSLTITVEDAYGNVVAGYTGTVHFTSSDGQAKLPPNYTFTAAAKGVHTFTGLILQKTGKQTITVADVFLSFSASVDVLSKKK